MEQMYQSEPFLPSPKYKKSLIHGVAVGRYIRTKLPMANRRLTTRNRGLPVLSISKNFATDLVTLQLVSQT